MLIKERTVRKFAFLPTMIYSRLVWLRFYYEDQEYTGLFSSANNGYIRPKGLGWVAKRQFLLPK